MESGETGKKDFFFFFNIWCPLGNLSSSVWGKYLKLQKMEEYSVKSVDFILRIPHPLALEKDFGDPVQMEPFT